jgi:hypothetical protein
MGEEGETMGAPLTIIVEEEEEEPSIASLACVVSIEVL